MVRYVLPETVVTIQGTVDLVVDTRVKDSPVAYFDAPTSTIAQSVRADVSDGARDLKPPDGGDRSWTVELGPDGRLAALRFNSVGAGPRVVAAGVKVLATIVGAGARMASPLRHVSLDALATMTDPAVPAGRLTMGTPPSEEDVRAEWARANQGLATHLASYEQLVGTTTAQLLTARTTLATADDPQVVSGLLWRIRNLSSLAASATAEVAKVEGLYDIWCEKRRKRLPRTLTYQLAIDELPVHGDATSDEPDLNQSQAGQQLRDLWARVWADLHVRVEIGPVPPESSWRPHDTGSSRGTFDDKAVVWRVPRAARLWVWRRGPGDEYVFDQVIDTRVTDRFSLSQTLELQARWFGEHSVDLVMDDLGQPTKLTVGAKGAAGAVADALAAAPEQMVAGLDAASKASATLTELSSAGAKQRVDALSRQIDLRTKELELQGLEATAGDFVELKRLKQQAELLAARGALAGPSELERVEGQLKLATANRDLDAVTREREREARLEAMSSEIAQLKAELTVLRLEAKIGARQDADIVVSAPDAPQTPETTPSGPT